MTDARTTPHGTATNSPQRMPVVFLPHGGGPWPFVDMGLDKHDVASLVAYLRSIKDVARTSPTALLVISAHWEEDVATVMTSPRPPMLYDYYGFPPASYEIQWPAPGAPELASRVTRLLESAGFPTATDADRGFDHGTFVPLKVTYPNADIPAIQLSLLHSLDAAEHIRLGKALAPLRDEGILIVGSGMSFHNLRMFRDRRAPAMAEQFDQWLQVAATAEPEERDRLLANWVAAPSARAAHPREEHLLPLMVVAGAAGSDRGHIGYSEAFMGVRITGVHYG